MLDTLTPQELNKLLACSMIRSLAALSNSDRGDCTVLGVARIVLAPIQLYRKYSIFRANNEPIVPLPKGLRCR